MGNRNGSGEGMMARKRKWRRRERKETGKADFKWISQAG